MSSGDPRLPASPGFNVTPHSPHQNDIIKDVVETQDFPHHLAIRLTPPKGSSKAIRDGHVALLPLTPREVSVGA